VVLRVGGSPLSSKRLGSVLGRFFVGSALMADKTVTRADLAEAVRQKLGLSRAESTDLVEQVLAEICDNLAAGESVKLSSFGLFTVRSKGERVGRNPKTGVEVLIKPRRVVMFNPSNVLKAHVNGGKKKPRPG
jgi:integration host factor subunit alpha